MQARAQWSVRSTSFWTSSARPESSSGTRSCATSTLTWCTAASTFSSISWRSSEMIETSPTSSSSQPARRSISAAVAARPAKTPKLTRISRPGASRPCTLKVLVGSVCIILVFNAHAPLRVAPKPRRLPLSGLPAEPPQRHERPRGAPGEHDEQRPALLPDRLAVEVDPGHGVDQVLQREHLRDRAQDVRVVARRPESARQEGHREDRDVDDGGGALGRSDERRDS